MYNMMKCLGGSTLFTLYIRIHYIAIPAHYGNAHAISSGMQCGKYEAARAIIALSSKQGPPLSVPLFC